MSVSDFFSANANSNKNDNRSFLIKLKFRVDKNH